MIILKLIFEKILEIFEESNKRMSSTRIFSFIILIYMMYFDNRYVVTHKIDYDFIVLNFIFLIAIFTPKYLQKKLENIK